MPESYYVGPAMATDWGERKPELSRSLLARGVSDGANPALDGEHRWVDRRAPPYSARQGPRNGR